MKGPIKFCGNGNCDCGCPDAVLEGETVVMTGDPLPGSNERPRIEMTRQEFEALLRNGHKVLSQ